MEWMCFYDMQGKIILGANPEFYPKPTVGDTIISQGCEYKVIEVCIDYDNRLYSVCVEKIES